MTNNKALFIALALAALGFPANALSEVPGVSATPQQKCAVSALTQDEAVPATIMQSVWRGEKRAVRWLRKAAEQGNGDAQCALGSCYANGAGVEKNLAEGEKWLERAAAQGNEDAKEVLRDIRKAKGEAKK